MSERSYTNITVSGPNADAAAKSAMEAILKQTKDECAWDSWCDDRVYGDDVYFDHDSGQGAVIIIKKVSRQFPDETFDLYVDGSCGDGYQGPVRIQNGDVIDARTAAISDGCVPESFEKVVRAMKPEERSVRVQMSPEQRTCYNAAEAARSEAELREVKAEDVAMEDISMEDVLGGRRP